MLLGLGQVYFLPRTALLLVTFARLGFQGGVSDTSVWRLSGEDLHLMVGARSNMVHLCGRTHSEGTSGEFQHVCEL